MGLWPRTCNGASTRANVRGLALCGADLNTCEDLTHEHRNYGEQPQEAPTICARNRGNEGIYPPGGFAGTGYDGGSGLGQCLSGFARGNHDCGNLSCRGNCHGRPAGVEGIAAGRKHCPYRRLHRRVRCRWRDFHHSCFLAFSGLDFFSSRRRLLEIHGVDYGGQHTGGAFHFSSAAGDGGGPGTPVPRIRGRRRNS